MLNFREREKNLPYTRARECILKSFFLMLYKLHINVKERTVKYIHIELYININRCINYIIY